MKKCALSVLNKYTEFRYGRDIKGKNDDQWLWNQHVQNYSEFRTRILYNVYSYTLYNIIYNVIYILYISLEYNI